MGVVQFQIERPNYLRLGADCGSDHEPLISKFRLKLKKAGKTTRHDLNQIPYNYTVEVRNRFKGLDLIDRVPKELWMEVHDIGQEVGIKTIPKISKCKKAKWLSEGALKPFHWLTLSPGIYSCLKTILFVCLTV